jgi:hypothetical protein
MARNKICLAPGSDNRRVEVTLNTGITPKPGQHVMLNSSGLGILPTYANGAIEELLLLEEQGLLGPNYLLRYLRYKLI